MRTHSDPELRALLAAAIRHADAAEASSIDSMLVELRFADLKRAAKAFRDSLSNHDRRRIGYDEKTHTTGRPHYSQLGHEDDR